MYPTIHTKGTLDPFQAREVDKAKSTATLVWVEHNLREDYIAARFEELLELPRSYRLLEVANIYAIPLLSFCPDFLLLLLALSGKLLLQVGISLSLLLCKTNVDDFRAPGGAIHGRESSPSILYLLKGDKAEALRVSMLVLHNYGTCHLTKLREFIPQSLACDASLQVLYIKILLFTAFLHKICHIPVTLHALN
jgi:hypothetical protein